jgi:hypothetical protein
VPSNQPCPTGPPGSGRTTPRTDRRPASAMVVTKVSCLDAGGCLPVTHGRDPTY